MKKLLLLVMTTSLLVAHTVLAAKPKPFNRVAVVIDSSGTFTSHQFEAIDKVKKLLDMMAEQREKRYQSPDEIYLISLDSKPDVIWYGQRRQLEQLTPEKLARLFGERRKYRYCTDVAAAFNLASYKLNRDPLPAAKYLLVFSDLIDEPPVSGSTCKLPSKPSLPSDDISWESMADSSIMVFWAPDDQIRAWETSLAAKGVTMKFYNAAEAQNVELQAPPKARFKMTETERQEKLEKIGGAADTAKGLVFSVIKYAALGFVGLIGLSYISRRMSRRRMPGKTNNQNGGK